MQPGDRIFSILFGVGSDMPMVAQATVDKLTDKRAYLTHHPISALEGPNAGPTETKDFSLRRVGYVAYDPAVNPPVQGGYRSTPAAIRAAIISLHGECSKLQERLELARNRITELEKLRDSKLEEAEKEEEEKVAVVEMPTHVSELTLFSPPTSPPTSLANVDPQDRR